MITTLQLLKSSFLSSRALSLSMTSSLPEKPCRGDMDGINYCLLIFRLFCVSSSLCCALKFLVCKQIASFLLFHSPSRWSVRGGSKSSQSVKRKNSKVFARFSFSPTSQLFPRGDLLLTWNCDLLSARLFTTFWDVRLSAVFPPTIVERCKSLRHA